MEQYVSWMHRRRPDVHGYIQVFPRVQKFVSLSQIDLSLRLG